jgi:hypothetical protein
MSSIIRLQAMADALNERQRAYLRAVYIEDQRREEGQRRTGGLPAAKWRWIEYGPIGAKYLDNPGGFLLRHQLDRDGLVDPGTGATWASLTSRGLVQSKECFTGFVDLRGTRRINSLLLRMTTDGRKVCRLANGEPATKPKAERALSLSALRLIEYGQQHPGEIFDVHAPWGMCPIEWLVAVTICRGLVSRGLLAGDAPYGMQITDAGIAIDVTNQPNWKPSRRAA